MIPENSLLNAQQRAAANALTASLDQSQQAWFSGYLAALSSGSSLSATAAPAKVMVLFGTESGNSEGLADKIAKSIKKKGAKPTLKNMAETSPSELKKFDTVLTFVSTWGDGEPPEAAEDFYKAFMNEKTDLSGVNFSVCALGDTSYDKFCQTGKEFDTRFETLGAKRIADRVDCDVDYEDSYDSWASAVLDQIGSPSSAAAPLVAETAPTTVEYSKKNPFPSEVLESILLNGPGTEKETIHVELDLEGSGLSYEAGDALAVVPLNCEQVVTDILVATGLNADSEVTVKGNDPTTLATALTEQLDITVLSKSILKKYNAHASSAELTRLLEEENKQELKDWLWGRQIIDLIESYKIDSLNAQDFVNVLRKLPPRLYSIASSPKAHEGEVHLTVAAVRYTAHEKNRKGVASTYLADEAAVGEKVNVYVHQNKNFRLPQDTNTPIIMVGPGTGIAPFRAFIEERDETGNQGGSWLFFGDQKYHFDFLYQLELQDHLKSGALSKLDVAFSRDQPEKVYVQHRMLERAKELYQWLEKGAHFYVCGDASRMADDVHTTLIEILQSEGGLSQKKAASYLDQMKKDKRYQRDVY